MRLQFNQNNNRSGLSAMMRPAQVGTQRHNRRLESGFICTFWEVLIAVVIVAVVFGTIIQGYLSTATRAQWTGYSLAAQSLEMQFLEQARSAVWDISNGKNELTNMTVMGRTWDASSMTLTGYTTNILDVPTKGTNIVVATNFISIRMFYSNNYSNVPVQLQVIRVDTVWPFTGWSKNSLRYYTNSISTYVAPDNRDPATLGVSD